jgi:hypothetical protein
MNDGILLIIFLLAWLMGVVLRAKIMLEEGKKAMIDGSN